MTDYTKLVEALRGKFIAYDVTGNHNSAQLYKDAASAIEALQKDLTTLQECYEIADTTVDEVLKQLPKRGEWIIHGEPPMLVLECSVCGQKYFNHVMQERAKYCSMCGAKMEVQDGANR